MIIQPRPFLSQSFSFLFLISIMLVSCKKSTPVAEAGTGDLAGFEMTPIQGSTIQYAVRKDGAGQVVFEGYVLDNKKTGEWIEYSADGDVAVIENYVNGLKEGYSFKLATRGQIDMKAQYHLGQLHGNYIQYKFGKVLEQRTYNTGKLDGLVVTYDERTWKVKQEVQYKNGLQDGYFRYYDDGVMSLEYIYKNGEKISGGIVNKG